MSEIPTPTRDEIRAARENEQRMAEAIPRSCAYCGEHNPVLDGPVSHYVCGECSDLMERAAEKDATDRTLVLMAVTMYGRARYDAAVLPVRENTERMDRAYQRVIALLNRALEQAEKKAIAGSHPTTAGDDAA